MERFIDTTENEIIHIKDEATVIYDNTVIEVIEKYDFEQNEDMYNTIVDEAKEKIEYLVEDISRKLEENILYEFEKMLVEEYGSKITKTSINVKNF